MAARERHGLVKGRLQRLVAFADGWPDIEHVVHLFEEVRFGSQSRD